MGNVQIGSHFDNSVPYDPPSKGGFGNFADLAGKIDALAKDLRGLAQPKAISLPNDAALTNLATKLYECRRKVDRLFELDGFSTSPAWDVMLDLFRADADGKDVSVSNACIGAACPPTTALRWLQVLEQMMLIDRAADPKDNRRTMVRLTEAGRSKVSDALKLHL